MQGEVGEGVVEGELEGLEGGAEGQAEGEGEAGEAGEVIRANHGSLVGFSWRRVF